MNNTLPLPDLRYIETENGMAADICQAFHTAAARLLEAHQEIGIDFSPASPLAKNRLLKTGVTFMTGRQKGNLMIKRLIDPTLYHQETGKKALLAYLVLFGNFDRAKLDIAKKSPAFNVYELNALGKVILTQEDSTVSGLALTVQAAPLLAPVVPEVKKPWWKLKP